MEKSNDVGVILKTERERRGLTLDVVQEATKIPIDSLKAIEEGYKIRTLTSFYYKSFVRLYAQHLGLDPFPILAMIPSYQPVAKAIPVERSVVPVKPDLRKLKIIAGPTTSFAWERAVPVVLVALAVLLAVGGLFLAVKHVAGRKMPVVSEPADAKASRDSTKTSRAKQPRSAGLPADSKKAEAPSNVPAEVKSARKVSLGVRAVVTAWITVKSDGSPVFSGSLKKGSFESWQAAKKIEISGKELDQMEYEVNGKSIGKLGRRDVKIRRVVVTPEGLSVEK